jgi:hypothetical protein
MVVPDYLYSLTRIGAPVAGFVGLRKAMLDSLRKSPAGYTWLDFIGGRISTAFPLPPPENIAMTSPAQS